MRTSRYLLSLGLLGLFLAQAAHADLTVQQRVEDFEFFWNTYKDAYVFFDLKKQDHGVDWNAIREQLLPRVQSSTSDIDLYAAVTAAQASLRDGHCYNGYFSKIRETQPIYFQRIKFKLADGQRIAVETVPEGSDFASAGIQVGDELIQFDGKTIRQLAEEHRPLQGASSEGMFWHFFANSIYIHDPLLGAPSGSTATLVFKKASGEQVEVTAPWKMAPPTGAEENAIMAFAGTPEDGVQLSDAEKLAIQGPLPMDVRIFRDWNIGYLAIESWMKTEDPIEQMEQVMTALKDTRGLVIDLRNNGGGVGTWGILFANYFVKPKDKAPNDSWMERLLSKAFFRAAFTQLTEEQLEEVFTSPETMHYVLTKAFGLEITLEEVKEKHFVNGRFQPFYLHMLFSDRLNTVPTYEKPVYVLTNGGCYSTTDIFLTILDEFERIQIVGTPNGAGSGSPIPFTLPNSKMTVYVPHARAYPPYGSMIEGRPREPDLLVEPTLEDMRDGKDTLLIAGVKALWEKLEAGTFRAFAPPVFELGPSESLFKAAAKPFEWGNVPTPDWAVEAKLRTQKFKSFRLKKSTR